MTKDIFSNQYWEKAWEDDPNTQDKRMKRAGLGDPSAPGFEKWAENFNKNSFTEESQHRTKRIMNWIEQQTGRFSNLSVLDVGAASGVFSVPFAKEGAKVTALEPSPILHDMLKDNANHYGVTLKTLNQSFEDAQLEELGQHDLVFASMCPAVTTWEAVSKAIDIAQKFVYVSLFAGPKENSIVDEVVAFLDEESQPMTADMYYLLQLLYFNDYTYETLIERHTQHNDKPIEDVMQQLPQWLKEVEVELDEQQLASVEHYLRDKYGDTIPVITGGKFGKVLIHV
ncbi:methyltransferase domain-containing protein [Staphylococcus haemolyticus]|uniref:class I SAM-dependent methyltransferase n=1 Tax=Staphylococcus haemolyticus TaxID=1283 RepID=UPI001F0A441F|nr:class I SAM-dependent methyltransferase [Staphylococcus haemolyticus]MCH4395619.1 methyltransferase domain-containing protein [Staphylococcus haemolyticus]MCH4536463.1 methyltransferase domain-containing protein [Staphylococcus haemolyticus]